MTTLLQVRGLEKHFPVRGGVLQRATAWVKAVDDVSFDVNRGEILGLVGESGSGKTTVGRSILRLIEPTAGSVRFGDVEVTALSKAELRAQRRRMQIVFQDPYASLNPRQRVRELVAEALIIHGIGDRGERRERVAALLEKVGLTADAMDRFPHEFSGGQRQRIGIARALAAEPDFIVADHLRAGTLETILDDFEPPALGIYAILPSNRYLPHRVRVLIDFLVASLAIEAPEVARARVPERRHD
jgi:ABC-type oligopeptide transport system ATPase subunit